MTVYDPSLEPLNPEWKEIRLPFANLVRSFVSGEPEGDRIRVRYFKTGEQDTLMGKIWFGPGAEGPPGHVHGGAQAAALDEICGGAVWSQGYKVVALKLETEFLSFVPLNMEFVLRGSITKREGRKIFTEGSIEDLQGQVLAKGRVLFLQLNEEQIAKLSAHVGGLELPGDVLPPEGRSG